MTDLFDQLALTKELPRYLREVSRLAGRPIGPSDLLSIEETNDIRLRANKILRQPITKFQLAFDEKRAERFARFVQHLASIVPEDVYVWTPTSNICGVLRPLPIVQVQFDFPFDLNAEGIVVLLTSGLSDQLLLDYSLGDDDQQLLEIEASGIRWGAVAY